eukprot:g2591.t1
MGPLEAFAVSSALAAMSTGIALNVLKAGGVLNQPLGQLCLAAAVVNEMYNIVLVTVLGAATKDDAKASDYYVPVLIMLGLVAAVGFAAIKIVPRLLDRVILPRVPRTQRHNVVLAFVFGMALMFMPMCVATGSSELLGAFLAGFCFCTDQHVHHTWNKQVKRVMHWTMRIFFACSIGFSVPISSFTGGEVWGRAGLFLLCIFGKLIVGVLATSRTKHEILALAFAWGGWGEFSFIIAKIGLNHGVICETTFNGLVLAVLISIVICPLALRITLKHKANAAKRDIARARGETVRVSTSYSNASLQVKSLTAKGGDHGLVEIELRDMNPESATTALAPKAGIPELHEQAAYYCIQTKSHARWGQQQALLSCVAHLDLKIIDMRAFHPRHHLGERHVVNELYLRDQKLKLPIGVGFGYRRGSVCGNMHALNIQDESKQQERDQGLYD